MLNLGKLQNLASKIENKEYFTQITADKKRR